MHAKILILDFGSQVTQLIARRVRDAGVFSEVFPYDVDDDFVRNYGAAGVILSGGPNSVTQGDTPRAPRAVFELGVPVLGICYGMQTMAEQLGGKVENGHVREFGYAEVRAHGHTALFEGISDFITPEGHSMLKVWMSHGDKVNDMPPGFKLMASTGNCPIAAMADEERHFYGVQFHPEVTHTVQGKAILGRFVHDICGCKSDWNMRDYIGEAVESIRRQVGSDDVILGLSGGVDSSVAAALIHRAIGDQLTCVFVDHGLLRLNEGQMVMNMFEKNLGVKVIHVNAAEQFMGHLAGVTDPEAKRKIIGREFVEVFQAEAGKLPSAKWLAQGTIYPDVIESAGKGKKGHTIKSHHNVGGLPDTLNLKLLEPLRELFKDEVRELGVALGLPHDMVYRHPFPGPGLGVRILGEVKLHYADLLRRRGRGGQELVRQDQPGLRRVPPREIGRRDGRWPHLRLRRGAARRADAGLHDGALGPPAARTAGPRVEPHHQRSARHQPRGVRYFRQAASDHRVGVSVVGLCSLPAGRHGARR